MNFTRIAIACVALATSGAASAAVVTNENFEGPGATTGWTVDGSPASTTGPTGSFPSTFLGRFGGNDYVAKTYALSGTQSQVSVAFDFLRIDSWDSETFTVYVNGSPLFGDVFQHGTQQPDAANSTRTRTNLAYGQLGFSSWDDEIVRYSFDFAFSGTSFELGFFSTATQGIADESFGIDNLVISDNSNSTAVPEPAAVGILGLGLLGLAGRRRFRRR